MIVCKPLPYCPTRDEAAEKTDAGRVAPISACVWCSHLVLESVRMFTFYRTTMHTYIILCATSYPYFFNCTIYLHPTLFACTTLIIDLLWSVGNSIFHLHTACTFLCTCLHTNAATALLPRCMTQRPHADG